MRPLLAGILILVQVVAGNLALGAAGQSAILDEGSFLRQYYRFGVNRYSTQAIKAEGEKVLGKTGMERTRRDTEKLLTQSGQNPAQLDWREHVMQPMYESYRPVPAPAPPEDWAGIAFDDRTWVLNRGPFQGASRVAKITDPMLGQFEEASMDLALQQGFYRAAFLVESPEQAGDLAVSLSYVGGARVLMNGEELARGHLPAGALAVDEPGEDYPAAAYKADAQGLRERSLASIKVPSRLLRKGINVLGIEVRASRFHPIVLTNPRQANWGGPTRPWPHGQLIAFSLRSSSSAVPVTTVAQKGFQVRVADLHHRTESTDVFPPEPGGASLRMVGARNGTYAGQLLLRNDKPLTGLRMVVSQLKTDGGQSLPGSVASIFYGSPYPLADWSLAKLGDERGLGASFPNAATLAGLARLSDPSQPCVFDRLVSAAPDSMPANTSWPVWISLRVPGDAAPGAYRGELEIAATGLAPTRVPIEFEVVNWNLPDAKKFQTWVGCEQNPYGVARHYQTPLWSDEHFGRIETSLAQLGRVGNTWLNVPVLLNTEFGNKDDSMIRWTRQAGGQWAFDYTILDRYLDLAIKHCGPPRVIQFVVMHGMKSQPAAPAPPRVKILDEKGQTRQFDMPASQREAWKAFATALYAHLKARGLAKAMFWGAPLEAEADPQLKDVLASCVSEVKWTAGPHEMMSNGTFAKNDKFYRVITTIRYWQGWPTFRNDQGWKSPTPHLLNPRVGGTVFAMHTTSLPFAYRMLPQRAVTLGRSGFTRVGADEWDAIHYDGMALPKWLTGMPVLFVLWPGADGAQTSVRFECMLEGIQETEARIFIEQALERGRLDAPTATRLRQMLKDIAAETSFFQGNSIVHSLEAYPYRWQERSALLYRAAAEVAAMETRR